MARHAGDSIFKLYLILFLYFGFLVYFSDFLSSSSSGVAPTRQSLFFFCAKKSNQKKAHNLTKIDPEITYSLWGGFIQYILAVPT